MTRKAERCSRCRTLQCNSIIALLISVTAPLMAQAAPVVEVVSPVANATICGTITVSAAASDPNGIAGVQFQYNGTNLGSEVTAAPYAQFGYTNNVADGVYTLTAVARSSIGEYTTSAPVSVTVNNAASYCSPKFTPTLLVYYGAAPTITSTSAQAIGKFDLLDTNRYRYYDINTSPFTWATIRATNPNTKIYLYEDGPEDETMDDSVSQEYLQGVDRYNVSRGHSMGSLNGNNPSLYLVDSSSNRIYNTGSANYWYLMDMGSTSYQSYWLEAVTADIVNQPWVADGVHADNCLTLMSVFWPYSAVPVSYQTDAQWVPAMNAFAAAITSGLHTNGQKLWSNRGGSYTGFGGQSAWLNLDASATPPDIVADEGAFAVAWGPSTWATQFYSESEWKLQVDTLAAIKNSKVAFFSHTKLQENPPGDTGVDNWNQPVTFYQTLWYALGSFALGKVDAPNNGYFFFAGNSDSYDRIWYYDEYDFLDFGKAVGPYSITNINGTNIYSREFATGYVYVNPSTTTVTVTLPTGCTCRQRTHDTLYTPSSQLSVVTTIQLSGHTAAFVLKT